MSAAGCGVVLPDPDPTSVEPRKGWTGEDTPVVIHGSAFYPQVEIDPQKRDGADIDRGFQVWLIDESGDQHELRSVGLEDYENLDAIVPAGLDPGVYDLRVTGPSGRTGDLADAFTVKTTRADRLTLDADDVTYGLDEPIRLDLGLLDPIGEPVLEPLRLLVSVKSTDGDEIAVEFDAGGLQEQQDRLDLDDPTIEGRLEDDGTATVQLTISTSETVLVTATPLEETDALDPVSIKLEIVPGSLHVQLTPALTEPYEVGAGATFDVHVALQDELGGVVDDPDLAVNLYLLDQCNDLDPNDYKFPQFYGEQDVSVTLSTATGTSTCTEQRLRTLSEVGSGSTAPITVNAGPASQFRVEAGDGPAIAGETMVVIVTPVDSYGNPASWDHVADDLRVDDPLGSIESFDCADQGSFFACQVIPCEAADTLQIHVSSQATSIEGWSGPLAIIPGEPVEIVDIDVDAPAPGVRAGEVADVHVIAEDTCGNAIPGERLSDGDVAVVNDVGGLTCALAGGEDAIELDCTFTIATPADRLDVSFTDGSVLPETSDFFEVFNGDLASVVITPATTTMNAGVEHGVDFEAFDAYGNVYLYQTDPALTLSDTSGTISPATAVLGASGAVLVVATITGSGKTEIVASQSATELGRSTLITVLPGPAVEFDVGLAGAPWAFVDDEATLEVYARDEWGNVADHDGTPSLTSLTSSFSATTVTVTDGVGSADVIWVASDTNEHVRVDAGSGLVGTSDRIAVVAECGASGPTPVLLFGGADEAVACHTGLSATITGSFSGSTAGSGTLSEYALWAEGALPAFGSSTTEAVTVEDVGMSRVEGLVVQSDDCGATISSYAWVGPNDGDPVGPLDLGSGAPSVDVGSSTTGATAIEITGATDCSGDPAVGGTVVLRSDRGEITGAFPTGEGLTITLNASGDGAATLDALTAMSGGVATVVATAPSGAAGATLEIDFAGDYLKPQVWAQTPSGDASGSVSGVTLTFSEPLLATSVTVSKFSVSGPTTTVIDTATGAGDGSEVEIVFDSPVDASLGTFSLVAVSDLRDGAGNKLDGGFAGVSSDYTGYFGVVGGSVDAVTGCVPSTVVFRPDGDDGAGVEADEVDIDLASASAPAWWIVSIYDAGGSLLRRDHVLPLGATDVWTWNGRDSGEQVVGDGSYAVSIDADDGFGNLGGTCTVDLEVANGWAGE